ncbi:MAG: helix-turn-helix domain-containing protein [Eubacteriales bacterium]
MDFSERLKSLREERDLKQEDIAKKLNVDRSTVGKWESSPSRPDYDKLLILADYFGVSTDYLLGRTDIRTPYSADEFETIAAHHEGEWTEEDLQDIEDFKEFIRSKKRKEK